MCWVRALARSAREYGIGGGGPLRRILKSVTPAARCRGRASLVGKCGPGGCGACAPRPLQAATGRLLAVADHADFLLGLGKEAARGVDVAVGDRVVGQHAVDLGAAADRADALLGGGEEAARGVDVAVGDRVVGRHAVDLHALLLGEARAGAEQDESGGGQGNRKLRHRSVLIAWLVSPGGPRPSQRWGSG